MNERIEKLLKRSGVLDRHFNPVAYEQWYLDALEKFGELVVRECAGIAKQTDTDDGDDYKSGRVWAGIDILKHFNVGVKE